MNFCFVLVLVLMIVPHQIDHEHEHDYDPIGSALPNPAAIAVQKIAWP